MTWLKNSTAITIVLGPFVDDTDGKTAETALGLAQADIRLSKNGGTFAQKSVTAGISHMENGYYSVSLSTADTDTLGNLVVAVSKAGALPVFRVFTVVTTNTWNSLIGGTATLNANASQWVGVDIATTNPIATTVIEGSNTLQHVLRVMLSALAGKASGLSTTSVTFRDQADTKNRISATVDANGNRSAVTIDGT